MNKKFYMSLIALPLVFSVMTVQAHSEAEHMENAEDPNCEAMKGMDHSKMNMSDPVMVAMMEQCKDKMNDHHPENNKSDSHGDEGKKKHSDQDDHH
mgnify:CR=1 FL=1